jgi:glyoxylase-like metal-dependent hydrolase (beta-lactamase superfamily II)
VIELASQVVLFDAPLTREYAREVLAVAESVGKPVTRLYVSHAHPDHFASAVTIGAPSYALKRAARRRDRRPAPLTARRFLAPPGCAQPAVVIGTHHDVCRNRRHRPDR